MDVGSLRGEGRIGRWLEDRRAGERRDKCEGRWCGEQSGMMGLCMNLERDAEAREVAAAEVVMTEADTDIMAEPERILLVHWGRE